MAEAAMGRAAAALTKILVDLASQTVAYGRSQRHEHASWKAQITTFLALLECSRELVPECIGSTNWEVAAAAYAFRAKVRGLVEYYDGLKGKDNMYARKATEMLKKFCRKVTRLDDSEEPKFNNFIWVLYNAQIKETGLRKERDVGDPEVAEVHAVVVEAEELARYRLEQFGEDVFMAKEKDEQAMEESADAAPPKEKDDECARALNANRVSIWHDGKIILAYLQDQIKELGTDLTMLGKLAAGVIVRTPEVANAAKSQATTALTTTGPLGDDPDFK
jgi:hypothetical protein